MKYKRLIVAVAALVILSGAAMAQTGQNTKTTEQQTQEAIQDIVHSGAPEQAATIQMGITPEQLDELFGSRDGVGPEPPRSSGGTRYKYTPKSPTKVETPPRLFNNVPKWR